MKFFAKALLFLASLAAVAILLIIGIVQFSHLNGIHDSVDDIDTAPVAIVLGASVRTDGTPSDALFDRVITAVELYRADKVDRLIMTGDDGRFHVDEVAAMKELAIDEGVPAEDVQIDDHGYRTYESCKRAVEVFDVRDAVIVTQRFHLARALYLCDAFDMKTQGLTADKRHYADIWQFWFRDLAASAKAWWDIHVMEPVPPVAY